MEATIASSQGSPLGRRRSFGKAHTPPEVRRSNVLQDGGGQKVHVAEKKSSPSDAVTDGSPVAERKISAPANLVQSTAQKPQEQKFYIPPDEEQPVKPGQERSYTPPLSRSDKIQVSDAMPVKQSVGMSQLAKSASDPNMLVAKNEFAGSNKHEAVSKRNSHEDENWYMAGIPRCVKCFQCFWSTLLKVPQAGYCAVPENIHTLATTEGIGISWGRGGFLRPKKS